jgi:hypothetical protein
VNSNRDSVQLDSSWIALCCVLNILVILTGFLWTYVIHISPSVRFKGQLWNWG